MKTLPNPNAKAMIVFPDEVEALTIAEKVLKDVQMTFGGDNTIMSLETGEVITPGELARARAILSFCATHRIIEVNPQ